MTEYLIGLLVGLIVTIGAIYITELEHAEAILLIEAQYAENLAAIDEAATDEFCYEPYGTAVQPERMSTKTIVTVNWFHEGTRGGDAFASWIVGDNGTVACEIWIHMPTQILGDPDMDGIGHEFLHCVAGDFHPEDE